MVSELKKCCQNVKHYEPLQISGWFCRRREPRSQCCHDQGACLSIKPWITIQASLCPPKLTPNSEDTEFGSQVTTLLPVGDWFFLPEACWQTGGVYISPCVSSFTSFSIVLNETTYGVRGRRGSWGNPSRLRGLLGCTVGLFVKWFFHCGPTAKDLQNHYLQPANWCGKSLRPKASHGVMAFHVRLKSQKGHLRWVEWEFGGFCSPQGLETPHPFQEAQMPGSYTGKDKASFLADTAPTRE